MPRGRSASDAATLAMALIGYEVEKRKIDDKIKEIRAHLGLGKGRASAPAASEAESPRKKRTLSVAARRRIAKAQRKRWAEHRKKQAQAGKSA